MACYVRLIKLNFHGQRKSARIFYSRFYWSVLRRRFSSPNPHSVRVISFHNNINSWGAVYRRRAEERGEDESSERGSGSRGTGGSARRLQVQVAWWVRESGIGRLNHTECFASQDSREAAVGELNLFQRQSPVHWHSTVVCVPRHWGFRFDFLTQGQDSRMGSCFRIYLKLLRTHVYKIKSVHWENVIILMYLEHIFESRRFSN